MARLKYFKIFLSLLVVFVFSIFAESAEIRILHINDFHGFAENHLVQKN